MTTLTKLAPPVKTSGEATRGDWINGVQPYLEMIRPGAAAERRTIIGDHAGVWLMERLDWWNQTTRLDQFAIVTYYPCGKIEIENTHLRADIVNQRYEQIVDNLKADAIAKNQFDKYAL